MSLQLQSPFPLPLSCQFALRSMSITCVHTQPFKSKVNNKHVLSCLLLSLSFWMLLYNSCKHFDHFYIGCFLIKVTDLIFFNIPSTSVISALMNFHGTILSPPPGMEHQCHIDHRQWKAHPSLHSHTSRWLKGYFEAWSWIYHLHEKYCSQREIQFELIYWLYTVIEQMGLILLTENW